MSWCLRQQARPGAGWMQYQNIRIKGRYGVGTRRLYQSVSSLTICVSDSISTTAVKLKIIIMIFTLYWVAGARSTHVCPLKNSNFVSWIWIFSLHESKMNVLMFWYENFLVIWERACHRRVYPVFPPTCVWKKLVCAVSIKKWTQWHLISTNPDPV